MPRRRSCLPPLTQTLDDLRADLLTWPTLKAVIGTALLAAVEWLAGPEVRRAALCTGRCSADDVRLYERGGYAVNRSEDLPVGPGIVHLEKRLG